MQQKMFKVMWATMALSLVAFCANPALAQDNGTANAEVLTTATDFDVVDREGGVVDCQATTPCEKAQKAAHAAEDALASAQKNLEGLRNILVATQQSLSGLRARTNPPATE